MATALQERTKRLSADQHASLAAPSRHRSISVDDFLEPPACADPESDSDADENSPVAPAQKRPRSPIRRSNSSFSLESDADDPQPPAKKPRPSSLSSAQLNNPFSRSRPAASPAPSLPNPASTVPQRSLPNSTPRSLPPNPRSLITSGTLSRLNSVPLKPLQNPLPLPTNFPSVSAASSIPNINIQSVKHVIVPAAPSMAVPPASKSSLNPPFAPHSAANSAQPPVLNQTPIRQTAPAQNESTQNAPAQNTPRRPTSAKPSVPTSSRTSKGIKPLSHDNLINLHMQTPSDGADWDRFCFFKHRPRRYDFDEAAFLSDFSPFTAVVAEVGERIPASVCAVCGAPHNLKPCSGCVCAFHARCVSPYPVTDSSWYCNGCRSAGVPAGTPIPKSNPPSHLSPAGAIFHGITIDSMEGNPIDFTLHPALVKMFCEQYNGNDWLQCITCKRRRVVKKGVLSESVEIPFECRHAFWMPENSRNCNSQMDSTVQSIENKIDIQWSMRGSRRKVLFERGFGTVTGNESRDPTFGAANVKLSSAPRSNRPASKRVTQPMLLSPKLTPSAPIVSAPTPSALRATGSKTEINPVPVTNAMETVSPKREQPQLRKSSPVPMEIVMPQPPVKRDDIVSKQDTAPLASKIVADINTKSEIPKTEDSLGGAKAEEDIQQDLLMYIAKLEFDEPTEDALTDLALGNDKKLVQIYLAFKSNDERFKRQAKRIAGRLKKPT